MPIDRKAWGHRRNAVYADYLTAGEIISELVETVRYRWVMLFFVF